MKRLLNGTYFGWMRKLVTGSIASLYMGLALVPVAHASDTEVYARKGTVVGELAPTMMMMIDTSGSMAWCINGNSSGCNAANPVRSAALVSAMKKILFGAPGVDATPGYVRMGLARYANPTSGGGYIQYPARPLDAFVDINPDGSSLSTIAVGASDAQQNGALDLTNAKLNLGQGMVGLNFVDVEVPKGATVVEAYIEFTAQQDTIGLPSAWEIHAQAVNTAPAFAVGVNDISSRAYETNPSAVAVEGITENWVKESKYRVNVIEPLNYLVNRSGWCGGNDIALRIQRPVGSAIDRVAYSFEGDASKAPTLVVNYSIDPKKTDSCMDVTRTVTLGVMSDRDDYEYTDGSNSVNNHNTELNFASIASNKRNQVVLRFSKSSGTDLDIPKSAEILAATIRVTGKGNQTNVPSLLVGAFNVANFASISSSGSTPSMPSGTVSSESSWSLPGNALALDANYSIDVKSQVQAIVNMAAWSGDNGVGFRIRSSKTTNADSKSGAFYHREASISKAAALEVKYRINVTDLTKLTTARDDLWKEISGLSFSGGTPLGSAYVETMRYMLGQDVYAPTVDPRATVDGSSVKPAAPSTITYKTPILSNNICSSNYVFALTDGEPGDETGVVANTKSLMQTTQACPTGNAVGSNYKDTWNCMQAVAGWGASPDKNQLQSRVKSSTVFFGKQDANSIANMDKVAKAGGGRYYSAGSEAELVNAISQTVSDLLDSNGSITAPGVAVNQLNRLNNLDQLFYAVFDPEVQRAFWPGNVKRYKLDIKNEDIYDVNNARAVDETTSFFKTTAKSWWSPTVDGEKAREGGAASVLPDPANRKMFTYTGSMPSSGGNLTAINTTDSTFINAGKTLTGVTDNNEFKNLINWYRGYQIEDVKGGLVAVDANTIRRNQIGGVLHSRPILVNYGFSGTQAAAATDPDKQDNVLYFSTLEGTLHAVNAKTGIEHFAFIPGEKLALLPSLFANPTQDLPEFGMDLTWSVLRKDENGDGTPEKIYIYGGMRMGGSNYYALDVTSRTSPTLKFAIKGGAGSFSKLGQTWSQPTVAAMRIGGVVKNVLVFGGGYDPQHEVENITFSSDGKGNAIYIVNAETGDLIASVDNSNNSDMKFGIPAQPKTIDTNGDGLIDHIYAGDMGGQIFRVDLDNRPTATNVVARVKTLAALAGTGVIGQRRFYEPPTVALFKDTSGTIFAAVGLGSGYRSHPLNKSTTDHFFMLFDYDVPRADILTAAAGTLQPTIAMSALAEVLPEATVTASLAGKKGWYVKFGETGEKIINSGVIFQNTLLFASYVPTMAAGDACAPVVGKSNLYRVSLTPGAAPIGVLIKDGAVSGMGGDPQLVVLQNTTDSSKSDIGIVTGTDVETFGSGVSAALKRTRWLEKTKQE